MEFDSSEVDPSFPYRDVVVRRGMDVKEFFDLQTEIGRGKFGTVYRCREKSTGLQLAAKFVGTPRREDRRNVEREVDIMRNLQHARLIQLYDAFDNGNVMCVVLELIEGGELFERVISDDFVLTEKSCTVFMRQICEGIEFIHKNNILHLDMKPENILCLTRTGNRIKIIDFGLARKYDPQKKLQVLFGTPEFVAPEVVNFDQIGFGTDMWSIGVICYVLLSGLSPFMGETDIETMANVTIAKYDFDDEAFNDISVDAKDFIEKLLVKDKDTQYIVIAVAACGRIPEVYNMIKSAIVFSHSPLMFYIFTEPQYVLSMIEALENWRNLTKGRFHFILHDITYPAGEDVAEWKKLVVSCASQRLFFPTLLPEVDSLLFVDVDILFMGSVEEIWNVLREMNATQEIAATQAYSKLTRDLVGPYENHPYYGDGGINAGVMLMNLTRLRSSDWTTEIVRYYHEYKPYLLSGDQDLVDIYMYFHIDRVKILSFRFNFVYRACRPHYNLTEEVMQLGIVVLHGTAQTFFVNEPLVTSIFNCWEEYQPGTDPFDNLYQHLKYVLTEDNESLCKHLKDGIMKGFEILKTF